MDSYACSACARCRFIRTKFSTTCSDFNCPAFGRSGGWRSGGACPRAIPQRNRQSRTARMMSHGDGRVVYRESLIGVGAIVERWRLAEKTAEKIMAFYRENYCPQ